MKNQSDDIIEAAQRLGQALYSAEQNTFSHEKQIHGLAETADDHQARINELEKSRKAAEERYEGFRDATVQRVKAAEERQDKQANDIAYVQEAANQYRQITSNRADSFSRETNQALANVRSAGESDLAALEQRIQSETRILRSRISSALLLVPRWFLPLAVVAAVIDIAILVALVVILTGGAA